MVILSDGTIDDSLAARTDRLVPEGRTFAYRLHGDGRDIRVTQNAVRAIQLAKGALYAGARLLMDQLGVEAVDRVVLAGAFGSHIDPLDAMVLGLIPDVHPRRCRPPAMSRAPAPGSRCNKIARSEIETLVERKEKVETAMEPSFQEHCVAAMGLPHTMASYPDLAAAVTLPAQRVAEVINGGRRRR